MRLPNIERKSQRRARESLLTLHPTDVGRDRAAVLVPLPDGPIDDDPMGAVEDQPNIRDRASLIQFGNRIERVHGKGRKVECGLLDRQSDRHIPGDGVLQLMKDGTLVQDGGFIVVAPCPAQRPPFRVGIKEGAPCPSSRQRRLRAYTAGVRGSFEETPRRTPRAKCSMPLQSGSPPSWRMRCSARTRTG
jgi:hypothetical protein